MKKFDLKSFIAGLLIGTLGITTAYAAAGIKSANLCDIKAALNGSVIPHTHPLISVTLEEEQEAELYLPANEFLTYLGYTLHYDHEKNTVDLIPGSDNFSNVPNHINGNAVIDLSNNPDQRNIAKSGSFQAENNQTLTLKITSDIKGGSVDFFLFDPDGKEQCITIESSDTTKEILLKKGVWKYNCSGIFQDGGNIKIVGTIR